MKPTLFFLFLFGMFHFAVAQKPTETANYGIVLSGGGALGLAHIGALQAFEEAEIEFSFISGASMGALVGAMYAYGYSPKDMIDIIEREKLYKNSKLFDCRLLNKKGITSHRKMSKILNRIFETNSFDSLPRFFALSMTNFIDLEVEYVFSGDQLKEKLMASAAIPAFFEVVELNEKLYVDGGVMNNLPIEPIQDSCSKVFMVDAMAVYPKIVNAGKSKIAYRAIAAMIKQMNTERIAKADYYIGFQELTNYHAFDFKSYKEIILIGYEGTKKYLQEHKP